MEYWLEIEDVNSILVNSEPNENHMHSCTYVLKYSMEFRLIKKIVSIVKIKSLHCRVYYFIFKRDINYHTMRVDILFVINIHVMCCFHFNYPKQGYENYIYNHSFHLPILNFGSIDTQGIYIYIYRYIIFIYMRLFMLEPKYFQL